MIDGVATGIGAIGILLAVGALIGTWALSGTIVAMVYYGLQILNPNYFYATTALICAAVAFSIGSSWTTAGTIGIGLMGIAGSMDLSPAITAGAVISGAYFGDKASPLSDTANLATAAAGSELFSHIRESLWTSVPALLIAVVGFALLGKPGDFDASAILAAIQSHVAVSLWSFLPLLLVLVLALLRFPPMATIFLGALAGGVLAAVLNPDAAVAFAQSPDISWPLALLKGIWAALATGYHVETGDAAIDQLMSRGGMSSMMVTVWLIVCALAFGAAVEHGGFLSRLVAPLLRGVRSVGGLVTLTVALLHRRQYHHLGPVHRRRASRPPLPGRIPEAGPGAGLSFPRHRQFGHRHLASGTLEQLRRLYGRDSRRLHPGLCGLLLLQHAQPGLDDSFQFLRLQESSEPGRV